MKVLSLFDGMACGMIAMNLAGVDVESYDAYEIDKYAVKTAQHNFPMIREHGDVFAADFTQYEGVDFMVGGSPCTYWSIAQTKNRETVASGIGWELFSQYVRALHEAKPKYFIYENNKLMSKEIRASIDKEFGFEAVCINSALVSAQNRQRLYWVGKRNADGTYSKVNVEQPEDRGILLRDILETGACWREKSYTLEANYYKGGNLTSLQKQSGHRLMVAEPVCVAERGRYSGDNGEIEQHFETRDDGKTNTLTTVQKDNQVIEPIRIATIENDAKNQTFDSQQYRVYSPDAKSVTLCGNGGGVGAKTGLYAVPFQEANYQIINGTNIFITDRAIRQGDESGTKQGKYVYLPTTDKSNTISSGQAHNEKILVPAPNGKWRKVYVVQDGFINLDGKQYPIKLTDGCYIIRKLTVRECMRLQTVPETYEFPVSNSQAYKMLGNGWTCEVIAHLIRSALNDSGESNG